MTENKHDDNYGCDEEEQIFLLTDDDGTEREMIMVYTFEVQEQVYAVLLDRNDPEADGLIFRLEEEEEGGEAYLVSIEDDEEWERVSKIYDEIVASEGNA